MLEEETVRWMLPTGATIVTVPKYEAGARGAGLSNRDARKRDRRERMEEWRQVIRETRLVILSEDDARDQICSSFRGTIARAPNSITSYIDGTRHLRSEIERYNISLRDRILQILQNSAFEGGNHDEVNLNIDMFNAPTPLPYETATAEEVKQYNKIAIDRSKDIYIMHPFTRRLDIYEDGNGFDYGY